MEDVTRVTLLLRLKDKTDQVSWAEFDARYHRLLYGYARARGASHDIAEEIVQEVELAVFKSIGQFEYDAAKGRFRGYLRRAVVNALSRRHMRDQRRPQSVDPADQAEMFAGDDDGDEVWEQQWRQHRIRQAMDRLSTTLDPRTIAAFTMHVLDERSVEETCSAHDITRDNLYQIKRRVLIKLRDELQNMDDDI
jgi:RNA polymerase sigma factor (sigma-70 family)